MDEQSGRPRLAGRVAIVTGAGSPRGIGRASAVRLAQDGADVVVGDLDLAGAETVAGEVRALGRRSLAVRTDVTSEADVAALVQRALQEFGRIDILVNNAGIFDFVFIEDMDEAYLDNILNVNFKSMFLMIKACAKYLKQSKCGRILNASSISSELADVGLVGYGASKAAVNMLTRIAAAELAPYSITVNAYAPGIIHTDLTDAMIKERGEQQVKQIPLNRFGTGAEVAGLVKFLVSEEAGYITGQIVGIDGGMLKVQNPFRAHEYARSKRPT
jgi:3-oxoacyl-[acyl-carrier protein] reductase